MKWTKVTLSVPMYIPSKAIEKFITKCRSCSKEVPADDNYCQWCGDSLKVKVK